MRKTYFIYEDKRVIKVLNETHGEMLAALKHRNPSATELIQDDELCSLHDVLSLLRLGHLKVLRAENEKGRMVMLEVLAGSWFKKELVETYVEQQKAGSVGFNNIGN